MKRTDFHYDLPPELIAQEALPRGMSRMLVLRPGDGAPEIEHSSVMTFPERLRAGDVVVVNDTKVFPARLFAEPKGNMKNPIEILLTKRTGLLEWNALCRPARRIRRGDVLRFSDALSAVVREKFDEGMIALAFRIGADEATEEEAFWLEIERIGATPLPPYIHRGAPRDDDRDRYQTVYARERGAVAAPTAGLHFTPELLDRIRARGVEIVTTTLHVGIGTFKPVKVDEIADHRMDAERYEISENAAASLNAALREERRIVAIGTTTVRTLESAAIEGRGSFIAGSRETSIFMTPGFRFRAVSALLTNFHLPESTLIMLVSAFAGQQTVRAAYAEAIAEQYRFYSFGDCMFIEQRGAW